MTNLRKPRTQCTPTAGAAVGDAGVVAPAGAAAAGAPAAPAGLPPAAGGVPPCFGAAVFAAAAAAAAAACTVSTGVNVWTTQSNSLAVAVEGTAPMMKIRSPASSSPPAEGVRRWNPVAVVICGRCRAFRASHHACCIHEHASVVQLTVWLRSRRCSEHLAGVVALLQLLQLRGPKGARISGFSELPCGRCCAPPAPSAARTRPPAWHCRRGSNAPPPARPDAPDASGNKVVMSRDTHWVPKGTKLRSATCGSIVACMPAADHPAPASTMLDGRHTPLAMTKCGMTPVTGWWLPAAQTMCGPTACLCAMRRFTVRPWRSAGLPSAGASPEGGGAPAGAAGPVRHRRPSDGSSSKRLPPNPVVRKLSSLSNSINAVAVRFALS